MLSVLANIGGAESPVIETGAEAVVKEPTEKKATGEPGLGEVNQEGLGSATDRKDEAVDLDAYDQPESVPKAAPAVPTVSLGEEEDVLNIFCL